MAYCVKCGALLEEDALFCTNCGSPIKGVSDLEKSVKPGEKRSKYWRILPIMILTEILWIIWWVNCGEDEIGIIFGVISAIPVFFTLFFAVRSIKALKKENREEALSFHRKSLICFCILLGLGVISLLILL